MTIYVIMDNAVYFVTSLPLQDDNVLTCKIQALPKLNQLPLL